MLKMLAMGGGELRKGETLRLDQRACELTGKRRPRALFIPTASGDSPRYVETFAGVYRGKLGCRVESLLLLSNPSRDEIVDKIGQADLIYVGGGNTLRMMRAWRRLGVDALLREAAARGAVMTGLSAGGICWFRYGESDSRKFSSRRKWDYIRVRGLGLVEMLFCPHYDSEHRDRPLRKTILKHGGGAIACDDLAAFEVVGDSYRVISARRSARTLFVRRLNGKVVVDRLPRTQRHKPLAELQ